jgi:hypothetical protein
LWIRRKGGKARTHRLKPVLEFPTQLVVLGGENTRMKSGGWRGVGEERDGRYSMSKFPFVAILDAFSFLGLEFNAAKLKALCVPPLPLFMKNSSLTLDPC